MIDLVLILLGVAIGVPAGNLLTEWSYDRRARRRSKIAELSGDRVITRMR